MQPINEPKFGITRNYCKPKNDVQINTKINLSHEHPPF